MGLLATFETLIREHGSASIRADQIDLLRDEIAVFERKLGDAMLLASQQTETIAQLQIQNEQANATIRDLQQTIFEHNQYAQTRSKDKQQVDVLRKLGTESGKSVKQIAKQLSIGEELVIKHLVDLCYDNCVRSPHYMPGGEEWDFDASRFRGNGQFRIPRGCTMLLE